MSVLSQGKPPLSSGLTEYLTQTYHPLAVILYGSYADGTQTDESDLDALLLVADGTPAHDTSCVAGVRLDVWIYPVAAFQGAFDPEDIIQICGGRLLSDTDGAGAALLARVADHVAARPMPTPDDVRESLIWCRKMLDRAAREDAEGLYRRHWLLTDSLSVAADVLGWPYLGPKKTLRRLQEEHPALFAAYTKALQAFDPPSLSEWISRLEAHAS